MRTRIVIGLVLVLGLMVSGPATAVAQLSDSDNAAQVQYPDITPREDPAADEDLPVTGFVALPLLLTGAVLLAAGGVMHVRTRRRD